MADDPKKNYPLPKFHFKLEKNVHPIAWATLIGGVLFVFAEAMLKGRNLSNEVTWTIAIAIGVDAWARRTSRSPSTS